MIVTVNMIKHICTNLLIACYKYTLNIHYGLRFVNTLFLNWEWTKMCRPYLPLASSHINRQ